MPSRTALRMYLAAGTHLEQLRFSMAHWAIDTGTSAHGARRELTYPLHSFFSRGVRALESTPGMVTSGGGEDGSRETSPPDCPWQVELDAKESRRKRPAVT